MLSSSSGVGGQAPRFFKTLKNKKKSKQIKNTSLSALKFKRYLVVLNHF